MQFIRKEQLTKKEIFDVSSINAYENFYYEYTILNRIL